MLERVRNRILGRKSVFADVNEGDYPSNEEIHAFGNKMVQKAIEELGKNSVEVNTDLSKSYVYESKNDDVNFYVALYRPQDKEILPLVSNLTVIGHYNGYRYQFRSDLKGNDSFEWIVSPKQGFVYTPRRSMIRSEVLFFIDSFINSEVMLFSDENLEELRSDKLGLIAGVRRIES